MSLEEVSRRIVTAETDAGLQKGSTKLIAVSKVQPLNRVEAVLEAGHRIFGENRVQEASGKWPQFKAKYPDTELHLLGPLQSNKVRQAVELFDVIHTLDRLKLAKSFARLAQEIGEIPEMFIQINTGCEPQKSGILPSDADAFVSECFKLNLPIIGLMCIPPVNEEASLHFALLKKIAERNGLPSLSMGMSNDYEKAIAFGATHVRVGSAIFGERTREQV